MANEDRPHGLAPIGRIGGGPIWVRGDFNKLAAFATGIFENDVVMQKAGDATFGKVVEPGLTTPGTTLPSGVAMNFAAASVASVHFIITDPWAIFEMQDNNDTDGFTAANEGLNANIETNAGGSVTHLSGGELDESTIATTSTLDLHILGLYNDPKNAYGSFSRVEVIFNKHRMFPSSAGV